MARNNALNFNLPSADDLFSTEEERAEARLEKVVNLSPAEISDFPNHPFKAVSYTHLDYRFQAWLCQSRSALNR